VLTDERPGLVVNPVPVAGGQAPIDIRHRAPRLVHFVPDTEIALRVQGLVDVGVELVAEAGLAPRASLGIAEATHKERELQVQGIQLPLGLVVHTTVHPLSREESLDRC